MKQFCIVIPVYKENLDCIEEISIKRLKQIIGHKGYDVFLVCPENMDCSNYCTIYNDDEDKLLIKYFDPSYFVSTASYSQLCISYDFYSQFECYEYMLIHQLDCYLFSDNIEYWCDKNYDYCGGPIISTDCGWDTIKNSQKGKKWQPYIGNGGFSLRKIETFMDITNPNGELRKLHPELNEETLQYIVYEDKYFCNDLYDYYKLDVPTWTECLFFAFDMSVDVIYNLFKFNGLPMACHSVDKNIRWWKNVIPELQDSNVIAYCEEKNKEFFKLYYDENNSTMR